MYSILVQKLYLLIPETFRESFGEQGFRKYFSNTSWLFISRIVGYIVSFFMVAYVARYLGPTNLGKLSFAQSFVAIFSVFTSLGIDNILVRDLVQKPDKENSILGTAFSIKLVFGVLTFLVTVAIAFFSNDDLILTILIGILSFSFIVQPVSVISHLINARVLSKYSAYITIFLSFFLAGLKILIIAFDKGLIFFASVFIVESVSYSAYYLTLYKKVFHKSIFRWRFDFALAKKLIKDSLPFLLAGLSGYIYARIDQVMIQYMRDSTSVGLYDAAVKLTDVSSFFPGIIVGSLFPAIVNARKVDTAHYLKRLRDLFKIMIFSTTIISLGVFLFAPLIVTIIFGTQFIESTLILRLYIWSIIAGAGLMMVQQYLITENFGKKFFVISSIGAIVNIALNLLLIPQYGTTGAAIATLVSYFAAPLSVLLFKKPRRDWLYVLGIRKNTETRFS